ncbi:MAG: response regulator [Pseudobutyrivibrio sp.]|nr:response regulator [Pseudobutyrivibrio sp.]
MLKVLIVEDEDIIRKGLAYTMDWMSMGCVIVGEASNGKEGIEKILEFEPNIVLVDIMMPYIDGMEMIRRTIDKVPYKSVILTSYAEFSYAQEAIGLKVSDYLLKPVDQDELRKVIARISSEIEKDQEVEKLYEKSNMGMNMAQFYTSASNESPYITQMLMITEQRFAEKISIESIASELGVSASYLSRKFKNTTGLTYLDFLNKYRVQQAIKLLQQGKYKIYEVSDMTGFTDYKHFNAVFKRYTNLSPSDFMR